MWELHRCASCRCKIFEYFHTNRVAPSSHAHSRRAERFSGPQNTSLNMSRYVLCRAVIASLPSFHQAPFKAFQCAERRDPRSLPTGPLLLAADGRGDIFQGESFPPGLRDPAISAGCAPRDRARRNKAQWGLHGWTLILSWSVCGGGGGGKSSFSPLIAQQR